MPVSGDLIVGIPMPGNADETKRSIVVRFKKFIAVQASREFQDQLPTDGDVQEVYLNIDLITRVETAGFQHTTPFNKFALLHDVTRITLADGSDQGVCVLMGLDDVMTYLGES